MFEIYYTEDVANDLRNLRARDRSIVLDRIEEQLRHNPTTETAAKKIVVGLRPPWHHEEPIWQPRVSEFRVFYDVSAERQEVIVRAIRKKMPGQMTEEIL